MDVPDREPASKRGPGGRWTIALAAIAAAGVVAYFALGMPGMAGMDDGTGGMAGMGTMDVTAMAVDVNAFATRMAAPAAFVVNVHIPNEGTIGGTDAAIPYSQITTDDRLPADKTMPILLYCKTGRMSKEAATALMDAGYRDVAYLDGGMDAWVAAGRALG